MPSGKELMPFSVYPGEEIVHRVQGRGFGLSRAGEYTITNRRVASVLTNRLALFGAGSQTRWLYLDLLGEVSEKRWFPKMMLILGALLLIVGLATVIFIVGIPLLIIGLILLVLAFLSGRNAIVLGSEGSEIVVTLTPREAEEFLAALHAAREAASSK